MILGDRIPAGQGQALVRPDLDFETYSEAGYVWNAERNRWNGPDGAPGATKGLPVIGAYNSIRHPSFEIVWLAYDLKDGAGRRQWRPGQPAPADLLGYLACGGEIEAWNVAYERWVWELYCVPALGWPAVREEQWFCAMAKARAFSLPGQLGKAGEVLALDVQKDKAGGALMKRLSMPVNPTAADPRTRVLPAYDDAGVLRNASHIFEGLHALHPDATPRRMAGFAPKALTIAAQDAADTRAYGDYNLTDIEAEAAVSVRVPELEGDELTWWRVHERINRRGVHIDRASVENCIAIVEQAFARYNGELVALCGVDAASKVQQLQAWLRGRGTHLDSLDEEHVEGALANPLLPPDVRRVLQIRAAVGSASIKKLYAIRNRLCDDDRLRDLYVYHGARTGRSTGEGPQPTNLPKAGPDMLRCACTQHYGQHLQACPFCGAARPADAKPNEWNPTMAEQALAVMATRSLEWAEHVYGQALQTIAGCLRAMFDAAPGHDLLSTDYNSIEAVGLAMLAGEQWRIDVFNTHGKIYEASASAMFGIPLDEILAAKKTTGQHHHLRQTGKVAELAFGYQGWLGAAQAFGMPGTDDEVKNNILAWRAASPAVEWLWGGQTAGKAGGILRNAQRPGYVGSTADWLAPVAAADRWDREAYYFGVEGMATLAVLEPDRWHVVYRMNGADSGIAYRCDGDTLTCRLPSGRLLTYHQVRLVPSDRGGWSLSYEGWNTNPKNGPPGWIRMNTWGGRLVENVVQATCREILRAACIVLERAGYPVVLHVYDEIVSEVPEGAGTIEEFETLVTEGIRPLAPWAADWPIRAPGGYRAKRYRKG